MGKLTIGNFSFDPIIILGGGWLLVSRLSDRVLQARDRVSQKIRFKNRINSNANKN